MQYQMTSGEWVDDDEPTFLEISDYRIKPQPKLIPFDFSDAEMLIGMAVRSKDGSIFSLITDLGENQIWLSNQCFMYSQLLSDYTFLYGEPCGKEGQS